MNSKTTKEYIEREKLSWKTWRCGKKNFSTTKSPKAVIVCQQIVAYQNVTLDLRSHFLPQQHRLHHFRIIWSHLIDWNSFGVANRADTIPQTLWWIKIRRNCIESRHIINFECCTFTVRFVALYVWHSTEAFGWELEGQNGKFKHRIQWNISISSLLQVNRII